MIPCLLRRNARVSDATANFAGHFLEQVNRFNPREHALRKFVTVTRGWSYHRSQFAQFVAHQLQCCTVVVLFDETRTGELNQASLISSIIVFRHTFNPPPPPLLRTSPPSQGINLSVPPQHAWHLSHHELNQHSQTPVDFRQSFFEAHPLMIPTTDITYS